MTWKDNCHERKTNPQSRGCNEGQRAYFFVLSTCFSKQDSLCFVRTVACGSVIQSSVDGQLTTSKTFTCTQSNRPIVLSAKNRDLSLEMGIHHRGNWETIGYTFNRWCAWLREMTWRDGKQDNIWKTDLFDPQMGSSGIWNSSPRRLLLNQICFIPFVSVWLGIWWTR